MKTRISCEWGSLRAVLVHRPGIEMFFGLLEPYSSLYERAFSRYGARLEHQRLVDILDREFKVRVYSLKDTILEACDKDDEIRRRFIGEAYSLIKFHGDAVAVRRAKAEFERNTSRLDSGHFFNIILLNPTIRLTRRDRRGGNHIDVTGNLPLANLYFMRDQQTVTDQGVVLGRMSSPHRRRETLLTRFTLKVIGAKIIHEVQPQGTFEGGDFMPARDFALIGLGVRTNMHGVQQLLHRCVKFDEIAIVHQPKHPLMPGMKPDPMVNMHLDTYFNIASDGVAIGNRSLLANAKVEIYDRVAKRSYKVRSTKTNLLDYLKSKHFNIIDVSTLEQLCYASNFLCVKEGIIVAVEVDRLVKRVLEILAVKAEANPEKYSALLCQARSDLAKLRREGQFFPHKKEIYQNGIDAVPITVEHATGGYGGAHCMTCPLLRS